MLRQFALSCVAATALVAFSPPVLAQQAFTADQRAAIELIIKDVLLKNPELIQEALVELEKRQQQAQVDAQKQVLVTERAAIFDSPKSAVAGNPQGDVTLVEFFDYNCGFCKRSLTDLQELIKIDPKLKVVLKDFPVLGADSVEASRVAVATKNQLKADKYWAFHVALMGTRGRVNGAKAIDVAKEHGANVEQLRRDMDSAETRSVIEETVVLGDRLGLTGTPAFVIADEIVFGAVGVEQIKSRIAAVRKCGRTNCG
ncbi:MAG: DsbA family protein [Bosea sp.]|jgi:protein-disulfide isomerase|nr:DsbA family protein [Bosea sp. (in: a-proteobacteria)]